jgi:anti-sigma B factor antagonist
MKIEINITGEALNIAIEGRLDTTTAPELESAISENCSGIANIVLDCKELAYVSSAGLRVLLSTHKKMKGAMKLVNVCELVMEVFEMTGFADIFDIE